MRSTEIKHENTTHQQNNTTVENNPNKKSVKSLNPTKSVIPTVRKGYKQTEVGLIPEDWEVKPFLEVSYMKGRIGWQGLNQTEFTSNEDQPFLITGMNFKDGEIRWNEVYHISEERYEVAKDIQLKKDDVLMTKDGTIGKLLFVDSIPYPFKASLNSHLLVYRPIRSSYDPKYLYYQLNSIYFKNFIELSKSGTTFFGISQESVGKYPFICPPLPEQQAIAEVLSDTDVYLTQLEQLIAKKKAIKQGAMQELLKPKEGWEVKKLGEVVDIRKGQLITKDTKENGDIPVIAGGKKPAYYHSQFNRNGITITISASGANAGYVAIHNYPIFASDCSTISEGKTYSIWFIFYLLQNIQDVIYKMQTGGAQPHIHPRDLKPIEFSVPFEKEQTRIATILTDMDLEIEQLKRKKEKAAQLKQGMMQELLTGRTRLV